MTEIHGDCEEKFLCVRAAFAHSFEQELHVGSRPCFAFVPNRMESTTLGDKRSALIDRSTFAAHPHRRRPLWGRARSPAKLGA